MRQFFSDFATFMASRISWSNNGKEDTIFKTKAGKSSVGMARVTVSQVVIVLSQLQWHSLGSQHCGLWVKSDETKNETSCCWPLSDLTSLSKVFYLANTNCGFLRLFSYVKLFYVYFIRKFGKFTATYTSFASCIFVFGTRLNGRNHVKSCIFVRENTTHSATNGSIAYHRK